MREALRLGAQCLAAAGIENPRLEARLLLAHATGMTPEALLAAGDVPPIPRGMPTCWPGVHSINRSHICWAAASSGASTSPCLRRR